MDGGELRSVRPRPPFGIRDVAVHFPVLNFSHPGIDCYSYNADVAVFALAEPATAQYIPGLAEVRAHEVLGEVRDGRPLPSYVDYEACEDHLVRWYVQIAGRQGPDFLCPPIHDVLARHFGAGYFAGCSIGA